MSLIKLRATRSGHDVLIFASWQRWSLEMVDSPVPLRSGDPMEEDRSPGAIAKMYHQSGSHLVIGALRYDGGRNTGRIESTRVSLLIHNSTQGWKNLRLYIHVRTCSMVFGLSYRVQDP